MYLKRIELTGFKSFADKTELEFVEGITAVVGPNGSGKSNISDGIRWVLGEQSAKSLRGGKMEDIIFSGSAGRKAVNYGEVILTLDNSDQLLPLEFNEVTVTRRIHRNGESEYLLNRQPCRLKDITELFMDTGIGREAYSIIGQGKIEEILSTRSEDRRGLFEEASGIVKFKSRKKEAQKKLDETEQNLLRIHDLVMELGEQIEPLREQSEKAMRYKQVVTQLQSDEISLYVFRIEQIYRAWTEANEQMQQLDNKRIELATIVNQHDALSESDRWQARSLEEELDRLHEQLLHISAEFEKCEGHGELLKERKKHLQVNKQQLQSTIGTQQQRRQHIQAEERSSEMKYDSVCRQRDQLMAELREEERRLGVASNGTSRVDEEQLKAELLDVLNQMAQMRNEIRHSEQQIAVLSKRTERFVDEQTKWSRLKEGNYKQRQEANEQLVITGQEISYAREQYMALNETIQTEKELLAEMQITIGRWEQKVGALVSRRDTMREMQSDYDGFQHGVKEVLKARNRSTGGLKGIRGAVAELIRVPSEVEVAIEIALGGVLQHIVVETEADGREAIAYLKKRQVGRATFLPLDVIQGRVLSEQERIVIQQEDGFVGMALDLIRFDREYEAICSSLLGHVIVSQTLEQANRIAAKCRYRYRVVTLGGDVVNAGGAMTGGSLQKKGAGLLGRQRQIDELIQEISDGEVQLSLLQDRSKEISEEMNMRLVQVETLRTLGEQKRIKEQQIIAEIQQLESEIRNIDDQLGVYEQDLDVNREEIADYELKRCECSAALLPLEEEESKLQHAIVQANVIRQADEVARQEIHSRLTELKVKAAAVSQEKQSMEEHLRRFQGDLDIINDEQQLNEQALLLLEQEEEINELDSIQQLADLNSHSLHKVACSERIEYARAERVESLHKLELAASQTKEQRTQLRQVEEQFHQTEVKVNRLDVELENLLNKLSEEYELSYELAKERYPLPEDVALIQGKVRELKKEIASLGEVNLGAIEEYARVNERYHFMNGQRNDLIGAKVTLYEVIQEMDTEMSSRFRIAFEAIRSQFSLVFAKLFGGGRADLVLSEPDQVLESGIEIVAQPPGKKLQNLLLLSGGERALTAIALLFSILRVKPVPFCVLDEVEAALDEANVARFAEYLREYSPQTQFIVVTHRKGTMEEADVLYGVTMEEDGVSKLVSVRLDNEESVPA